jgi:hypothetical protein
MPPLPESSAEVDGQADCSTGQPYTAGSGNPSFFDSDVALSNNLQVTTPPQCKRLNDIANQIVADLAAPSPRLILDDETSPSAPTHRTPVPLAHLGALAFGIAFT